MVKTTLIKRRNRMYYCVVPRNEGYGLKELRVSTKAYTFWANGPESGVIYEGKPIEDATFSSSAEAYAAISKAAPQYMS